MRCRKWWADSEASQIDAGRNFFTFKNNFIDFQKERETLISCLPLTPQPGTKSAT